MSFATALDRTLAFLRDRKKAYQLTFGCPVGQDVLRDLAKFCRAEESAAVPGNDHLTWALIGRREVFLRIQQHMNLSTEELAELLSGKTIKPKEA